MDSISKSDKTLIIGPSHVVRWKYFIENNSFPDVRDNVDFIGIAGCPIWHDAILSNLESYSIYKKIFIMVGDFRFGNKIFESSTMEDAFGIKKEFINEFNDRALYERSIQALIDIRARLGDKVKFIFWDLILRENRNRLNGRYINAGFYAHPVWNYSEIQANFDSSSIDFREVISSPILTSFFIDNSNHPTMLGYSFLLSCALDVEGEFESISIDKLNGIARTNEFFQFSSKDGILISGDCEDSADASSFIKFLVNYSKKRIISLSNIFLSRTLDLDKIVKQKISKIVLISSLANDDSPEVIKRKIENIENIESKLLDLGITDVRWLFWENHSKSYISNMSKHRIELLSKIKSRENLSNVKIIDIEFNGIFSPSVLIEKNKAFHPSLLSLTCFFEYLSSDHSMIIIEGDSYFTRLNRFFESAGCDFHFNHTYPDKFEDPKVNKNAKILMSEDRWSDAVVLLANNVDDQGENKLIKKIIYDKTFRPKNLKDQADLLILIHSTQEFPLYHRLNALTAYCHKVMESMQLDLVDDAISLVLKNLDEVNALEYSDYIRNDKNHIKFSMLTVLWHLYLFKGDIVPFLDVGIMCVSEFEAIDSRILTKGFYQTCTNLIRCLCVAYLGASIAGNVEAEEKIFNLIEKALWLGIVNSDDHKIKFIIT
ncbi:MAG: hypothetical protein NWQ54_01475 [Paraglaciecola sp.]|nr:hypothetical protein [Paraglaciecola sp.]